MFAILSGVFKENKVDRGRSCANGINGTANFKSVKIIATVRL